ncbi:ABC1 family [Musa troglodytarum]|uniref:ABC1 family n=1 Tax=Musa troglodytarum TaxID=320322 RepID=A0A9E7JW90_9LILI|nr:ABC1 family [Musa troglodytarum]
MLLLLPPSSSLFASRFKAHGFPTPGRLGRQRMPLLHTPRRRGSRLPALASSDDVDAFTKYSGYLFEGGASSEAEFLDAYDLPLITSIYRRKPFLVLRRFLQISATFGRWFTVRYLDSVSDRSDEVFKASSVLLIRAAELRAILLELGPAFVKIAQAVSSRPDVIPPAYLEELSLLQDRITPFSSETAFNMIEKELGQPIDILFSEISPEPIAAASLGQVYQARLRSSGKVVAVKVQRPGVQAAISLDIFILRYIAGFVRRAARLNTDLQAVLDEWASSLFREMDYRAEAMNGLKFRKLYGGLQDVFVPEMYLEQSSRRVLIMEWVDVGVYCSLSQLLDYGFYHADPHPGNLLRTSDGKLAYLDFGMMGEFRQELRDGFIQACLHMVNRDFDALSNDFITLGLLPPTAQKDEVTKALTGVFQNAVNKGVRNISFGDLSGNLGRTMYKFKFQIPSYFSLVIRSLAVLEGIAISFDPNYKVLSSSYPWIARKVLTDSSPQLQSTLQTLLYKEGVFRIDRLESLLTESLRAKTEQSLVRKEVEDSDSNKAIKQVLSFTLTEKGAFVREILLQEFAKGIDALGLATLETLTSAAAARLPFSITQSSSFMDNEDIANLRTLNRLLLLPSRLQKNENPNSEVNYANSGANKNASVEEVSLVLYQMTSAQDILPILSVIPELPSESQQQLVRLPADLAGRLLSRVVARSIRRIFV